MQSHDVHHTGLSQFDTINNSGSEKWRLRSEEDGEIHSSSIIDRNGTVYFCTTSTDSSIYSIYQNGTQKWRFIPDGAIWSTPVIDENGTLYFGISLGFIHNYFYAIQSDETVKWTFITGGYIESSPAIGSDGTIYFGCDDKNIYALLPNGTEKWHYRAGGYVSSGPAIGDDGTIYVGSGDHYLYALYPNGTLRWRFGTGSDIKGDASIAHDGTIYVPSFDGYLYALNPNGTMKWQVTTGDSIAAAGVAIAEDGTIYVGTEILRAYYPNGTLKWAMDFHGNLWGTVPAVSADGTIFVSGGGYLVALNPDGSERWRCPNTGYDYSSPSIGADGTVYVCSFSYTDNFPYVYLHAIGPGEQKRIQIQSPQPGNLYIYGISMGSTQRNTTIIIGSTKIKIQAFSEDQIDTIYCYVDGQSLGNLSKPPFEWTMNHRYGKWPLMKHTITVTAYYKGGCSWTESLPVWYFHLRKNYN